MKKFLPLIIILASNMVALGQQDSIPPTKVEVDTVYEGKSAEQIEMYADKFIPRRASLYAAILPGAGQIYNKKYWKVPLVYGGFAALGYAIYWYDDQYHFYRTELFKKIEDPSYTPVSNASESQLRTAVDKARRERDFWVIMTGAFYLLQIADAHIDAHLKEFDLNPKLKVTMEPMMEQPLPETNLIGMSLKLHF